MISCFCCDFDEVCALLGCYAAWSANPLLTFWDMVPVPCSSVKKSNDALFDFMTLEDGTGMMSQRVGKGLPLDAV
jgi:hypothetical protein